MKQLATAAAMLLVLAGTACTDKEGPAERAGERLDDAVSEARDRLEEAGDEVREAGEEIRDSLQNQ